MIKKYANRRALPKHNMKMFQAAASAFIPGAKRAEPPSVKSTTSGGDLDALREQMAEMQRTLDALGICQGAANSPANGREDPFDSNSGPPECYSSSAREQSQP